MKSTLIIFFIFLKIYQINGQIGIASGRYLGKDQDVFRSRTYFQISLFIPLINLDLYSKKKEYKIAAKILPSFKFLWYNFNNNLVVISDSNVTTIENDRTSNHVYKRGLFKKTSQMYISSFFVPLIFPIWFKKTKNCLYSPGIWAEYIIGGKFSRKFYIDGEVQEMKNKFKFDPRYYSLNKLQYGICASFTYKFVSISSIYSLVPLFNKNSNISVNRFETIMLFDIFWKRHPYLRSYNP